MIGRIIVGIGGAIASLVIVCCTFWIWMLPLVPIVALAVLSGAFPPLLVLTAPLILALVLVVLWIIATLSAPIFLFYRSWSVAFLQRLDPDFRGWNGGDEPGSAPPLDDPPVADASSSSASSWSEPEPPSPGADERPDGLPPEDPR